jgi:adenylate kinase
MGSGVSKITDAIGLLPQPNNNRGALSTEKRIRFLKETPFYQYLTPETIDEFARCFTHTMRSKPGKSILLDAHHLYVVCEGEVDLSTSFPEEGSKLEAKGYLCRKRRGDIVNVCQTKEDVQRRMTVRSHRMKGLAEDIMTKGGGDTAILLLCGDVGALDKFSKAHAELSKPIVAICETQIEDRLLSVPFLREIPKSKLTVLAAMCRYEAYESGQIVFEEDSHADKLFLVLSGVAQVVAKPELASSIRSVPSESPQAVPEQAVALKRSLECSCDRKTMLERRDAPLVPIAELKSGDYFGETGLVFNIDRTCGVRTAEKCLFLTVHKTDFENFLKICPIEETLKRVIKQRMVSKLSSLGIPFLKGIPEDMLSSLASSVSINEVPKDHIIFKQGDVGDRFYIIVQGSVMVDTKPTDVANNGIEDSRCVNDGDVDRSSNHAATEQPVSEHIHGSLGPGQYFGEMSLVSTDCHLRSATVTSTQKSIFLSTDKESFLKLFGPYSNMRAEFELRLMKSSATLKQVLAHSLGVASFRDFLEAEHAGENIDFWVVAKNFRENTGDDLERRKEQAKQIFMTFCAEFADRQVNLAHTMLAKIETRLYKDNDVAPDLFDAAMQELFRLMEKDKFGRYKKSDSFKSFLARLGILSLPIKGAMTSPKEKRVTLESKRNDAAIERGHTGGAAIPARSEKDSTKTAPPKLIIAGAPASGKGTQCELIKQKYGVVHLSTGDMLRAAVAAGTDVGKQAKDYMDAGKLVPDDVIIGVVKERLAMPDCVVSGWLLDGFPRTPAQGKALADAGVTADCFVFLNVPDDILVERVVGRRIDPVSGKIYHMKFNPPKDEEIMARLVQRSDDTDEKVKVRLEQFHSNVAAVKGRYADIAIEVDGTKKPEVVSVMITKSIDALIASRGQHDSSTRS